MKYEIIKGSEKDFEDAPEWARIKTKSYCYEFFLEHSGIGAKYVNTSFPSLMERSTTTAPDSDEDIIAERRPITEPELKPIYGDGIHDDSEALQQRIDMGIDINNIIGEQGKLFNISRPLQFNPITEPAWSGEGVPCVGQKVMTKSGEGIIDYVGSGVIVYSNNDGQWSVRCDSLDYSLSAIRSPEDVARDESIEAMRDVGYTLPAAIRFTKEEMAALYDAGYRKTDQ